MYVSTCSFAYRCWTAPNSSRLRAFRQFTCECKGGLRILFREFRRSLLNLFHCYRRGRRCRGGNVLRLACCDHKLIKSLFCLANTLLRKAAQRLGNFQTTLGHVLCFLYSYP